MRTCSAGRASAALALVVAACGVDVAPDPGPPPPSGYEALVRERQGGVFAARYPLAGPSQYRFAQPVPGRVARWHWEPQADGGAHSVGYRHGWSVGFWVRPSYRGYPEQPESQRIAFFAGGELRGIFAAGRDTAIDPCALLIGSLAAPLCRVV